MSAKAGILKHRNNKRRRTPGTICLCAIEPSICPQCSRSSRSQSQSESNPAKGYSVSFGSEVRICRFGKLDVPRRVNDDSSVDADSADSSDSADPEPLNTIELSMEGTNPRKFSEPMKEPQEPSATPNQGKKVGKSHAALVEANLDRFQGQSMARNIARDRAMVNYAEVSESKSMTRKLSDIEKQALTGMDANGYRMVGEPSEWAGGNRYQHFHTAAEFLAQGAQAKPKGDVSINLALFTPPLFAMTDLLQILAETRGQAYSSEQLKAWKTICQQLCTGLKQVVVQQGRTVCADVLREELVDRVESVLGNDAVLMGRAMAARSLHCDFRTMVEWLVGVAGLIHDGCEKFRE